MFPQRMKGFVIFEIISILNSVFFSWKVEMSRQRMYDSLIFEIISILNCLSQLEFECPNKEWKVF